MGSIAKWWDRAPCEAWHGTAPTGSIAWSQQVSAQRYFVQPHILSFADFSCWKGKNVLEIGCGIGTDTLEFSRAGAYVDAVDQSIESIKLAESRLFTDRVRFWCVDAELPLPFAEDTYDLAYSFGMLHHTPYPECVLRNMWKCLKPGGELRIMVYAKYSVKFLLRQQPEAQAGCPLVRTYTCQSATQLIESSGFKVTSVRKDHIFPYRIPDYVMHRYVKAWPWNWIPEGAFKWLEGKLGHHLLVSARKP